MRTNDVTNAAPWFRQRWPWLLMAGPAIVVVAGFITLGLAINSADGLVADDYYKQGKAINRTITRDTNAAKLGYAAQLKLSTDGRLHLAFADAKPDVDRLRLKLHHPTRAGFDREILLARTQDGSYTAAMPIINTTRWSMTLEDNALSWRLTGQWRAGESNIALGHPQ
jgi:uncharacterized protein